MSEEQAKHYTTMREYLFAADDNGNEVTATNILSRTLRLQQILAGIIGEGEVIDNPRLKALEYAIEMTGSEQFIIWTIFQPTYKQIGKVLEAKGITYGLLTGEQDQKIRDQNMADFQAGKLRCLIAHPRAGGVGVNLTAASYSIHYTKSFNLVDDMQCEARNYRGGSERHDRITRIDIITQGTIDEDITYALRAKKTAQDFIMNLKGK
jgi:SNF2 family DNA or RNA helicase